MEADPLFIQIGFILLGLVIVLLCIGSILISLLSMPGPWLTSIAALLALFFPVTFPGWWTIGIFFGIAVLGEVIETVAGYFGVTKRGGSKISGWAGIAGGLLGMGLGTFIPIPLIGSLIGMLIAGFVLVFAVEYVREKKASHAGNVATGVLLGRIIVIFVKTGSSAAMSIWLIAGLLQALL